MPNETPLQQAMRELRETSCPHCKGPKRRMNSFCPPDYFRLPKEMQRALYKPATNGYVEAYEKAKAYLAAKEAAGEKLGLDNLFPNAIIRTRS